MRKNTLLVGEWKIRDRVSVEIEIDQKEILLQSFKISEVMITKFFDKRKFADFQQIILNRNAEIIEYKNKLKNDVSVKSNSAVNERNRKIKNL